MGAEVSRREWKHGDLDDLLEDDKTLMLAVHDLQLAHVNAMIERGANVNCCSSDGTTPLMVACSFGWRHPSEAMKMVRTLLAAGADPVAVSKNGLTPLHFAGAHWTSPDCVQALLSHPACQADLPRYLAHRSHNSLGLTAEELATRNDNHKVAEFLASASSSSHKDLGTPSRMSTSPEPYSAVASPSTPSRVKVSRRRWGLMLHGVTPPRGLSMPSRSPQSSRPPYLSPMMLDP